MSAYSTNNVVQMFQVNENPDSFDVMDCRNNVIDTLDHWGGGGKMFNCHSTLGNTIYFDYNKDDDSQSMKMAMKVQTEDDHEQMVAVWDMHVIAESKEQFIEMYSKWYDMYKAPQMEARKNGGGDDAVANS